MNALTSAGRNFVACHETGHALGLMHNSDAASCVNSANFAAANNSTLAVAYSPHDQNHLNTAYD